VRPSSIRQLSVFLITSVKVSICPLVLHVLLLHNQSINVNAISIQILHGNPMQLNISTFSSLIKKNPCMHSPMFKKKSKSEMFSRTSKLAFLLYKSRMGI
jgi:hypothetical protein